MEKPPPSHKRPSPDTVIDLCGGDSDDDNNNDHLKSVTKRLKSGETPCDAGANVKLEGAIPSTAALLLYDDVEVLEKSSNPTKSTPEHVDYNNNNDDDDGIAVVGTLNHVRLPHMRQHCTEKPFSNDTGYSLAARMSVNGEHCNQCYCYVCDVPVPQCLQWKKNDHCLATDQGTRKHYWALKRDAAKAEAQRRASFAAMPAPVLPVFLEHSMASYCAAASAAAEERADARADARIARARAAGFCHRHPSFYPSTSEEDEEDDDEEDDEEEEEEDAVITEVPAGPPHARHECPVHIFTAPPPSHDDCFYGHQGAHIVSVHKKNALCCTNCVCYGCGDKPVSECSQWRDIVRRYHYSYGHEEKGHCNAHPDDKDGIWNKIRQKGIDRQLGMGPFEPNGDRHDLVLKDEGLTKCRHCGWYSRLLADDDRSPAHTLTAVRSTGYRDWCHACGRVASAADLAKVPQCAVFVIPKEPAAKTTEATAAAATTAVENVVDDNNKSKLIGLGTKEIAFTLHAHDPRQMGQFAARWATENQNGSAKITTTNSSVSDAVWTDYDESLQEEELFQHRLGSQPMLSIILGSIAVTPQDKIPADGICSSSYQLDAETRARNATLTSANETEAVVLEQKNDLVLLRELYRNSQHFRHNRAKLGVLLAKSSSIVSSIGEGWLFGDIAAVWDRESRRGTFKIRCWVKSLPTINDVNSPTGMARFFAAWFGVVPFKLSDLHINLTAETAEYFPEGPHQRGSITVPPFSLASDDISEKSKTAAAAKDEAVAVFNADVAHARTDNFALESGAGSELLGGTHAPETDLTGTLKRFLKEIIPDCVCQRSYKTPPNPWLDAEIGIASDHRTMHKRPTTIIEGLENVVRSSHGIIFDSFLSREDYAVALRTTSDARALEDRTSSLTGLMNHMENRGHAAASFVEGLTVELLPFQSQSLQWAMERETAPGGLQSFFWTTLPKIFDGDDDDPKNNAAEAYFNPILGKVTRKKPKLVRGGIIAEQMGLGKTVISLALILQNPAPAAPPSGSPVASIPAQQPSTSPFWDPTLFGHSSVSNKKRGSILSRGTLVVCNVSLVGQWIEEAKSKLKDPGLVYSYHGGGRKRNPLVLAANSIVVTTYETLASDATFHASKSKDVDYCAPCEQVRWWRIICDESHVLRNGSSVKSVAVMSLVADNKWLVSGTPINTTVMDLKNQLKFLGIEHTNEMMELFRRTFFSRVNDAAAPRGRRVSDSLSELEVPGFGMCTFFMRSVMIRHSQNQKYSGTGTTLMSLPPKTERVVTVTFSAEEQAEYEKIEHAARDFYNTFKLTNHHKQSSHYLLLTQKLTPLRIACSGGQVPLEDLVEDNEEDEGADVAENEEKDGETKKKKKRAVAYSDFAFTSKLMTLVNELKRVRDEDSTAKSLVFSQYTSTLKYLQTELPNHGFQFRTLSGDMSMVQRAKSLRDFQNDPPTTVFLLSMRAGAVGINLTQANCVFLMEPCFNPALEAQAIGRVQRLGQTRSVEIVRLVMQDSVETRIRTMLDKKYGTEQSAKDAYSDKVKEGAEKDTDEEDERKPAAKLFVAPAITTSVASIGCIRTDKAAVMADEFDLLFGVDSVEEGDDPVPDNAQSSEGMIGFI